MSMLTLEAKLERTDPATPWGFRMQGGKDYGGPLAITKVNGGSLAAKCGVHVGDLILKIGNLSADVLKHKEAQDTIVASGNKLDLLLQRLWDEKTAAASRGGSSVPQSTGYDMFSPPSFNRQGQASGGTGGQSQNYNASAKPFGASSAAPVDNLTNRLTQGLSMNSGPSYQPAYDDGQHTQSGSFNRLKNMMDGGQVPVEALKPLSTDSPSSVERAHSPVTVQAAVTRQYNNPIGLYSTDSLKSSVQTRTTSNQSPTNGISDSNGRRNSSHASSSERDEHGGRKYSLSETYKLVHERQNSDPKNLESPVEAKPTHSKSFKLLQDKLDNDPGHGHGKGPSTPQPAPVWGQQPAHAGGRAPPPPAPPASTNLTARPWQSPGGGGQAPGGVKFPPPPGPGHAPGGPTVPTGVGAKRGQKGDAVFTQSGSQARIPICASCGGPIRGPFVMAMGKTWCPDHFVCANARCGTKLLDIGFVEEGGFIYCERDYEMYFAPHCNKCGGKVVGACVKALDKDWHPGCFLCIQCKKPISGTKFHVEDGNPYCEDDWKKMYQTQCVGCGYAIEPGDRWVEAMNHNYHAECFNCSLCQVNLDGKPFVPKGGKPYCKTHGR